MRRRFVIASVFFIAVLLATGSAVVVHMTVIHYQVDRIVGETAEAVFALQGVYGESSRLREEAVSATLLRLLAPHGGQAIDQEREELSEAYAAARRWVDTYRAAAEDETEIALAADLSTLLSTMYADALALLSLERDSAERVVAAGKARLETAENRLIGRLDAALDIERTEFRESSRLIATSQRATIVAYAVVLLVILVFGMVAALYMTRRVLKPLEIVGSYAASFHPGQSPPTPEVTGPPDVVALRDAVARMARRTTSLTGELTEQNERLRRAVEENDVLVREVHHRVKNNLQVIIALLRLQAHGAPDGTTREHLENARSRLFSMALVHERLYASGDLSAVDLGEYLPALVDALHAAIEDSAGLFEVRTQVESIHVDADRAVHVGLIVNELVANAVKHARGPDGRCRVGVSLTAAEGVATLTVHDNGSGLLEGAETGATETLGMQIITLASRQMEGEARFVNDDGLRVTVRFPVEQR